MNALISPPFPYDATTCRNFLLQTVELKVQMTCSGCVGAVKRVLDRMDGVKSYDVNLEEKKVTVVGDLEPRAVLEKVAKTGKATSFWNAS